VTESLRDARHSELCAWRFGINAACDCKLAEFPWKLVNPSTGNVVGDYDTEADARDAAAWYEQSYGKTLDVRHHQPTPNYGKPA
jgi:hypothetical protein